MEIRGSEVEIPSAVVVAEARRNPLEDESRSVAVPDGLLETVAPEVEEEVCEEEPPFGSEERLRSVLAGSTNRPRD